LDEREYASRVVTKEINVTAEKHHDTSENWLYFFFVCFGIILLGIVFLFARNVNDEPQQPNSSGGHSMILPQEQASHRFSIG
jgi:hypothetical protein